MTVVVPNPVTLSVVDIELDVARTMREDAAQIVEDSRGSWRRVVDEVNALQSGIARSVRSTADDRRLPILVRGLPVWNGYRTPPSRAEAPKAPQLPDLVPLMLMAELGHPMAFSVTQDGRSVQDIVATDAPQAETSTRGRELDMHIEAGYARFKPDHVGLYCMYNDDRVGTILSVLRPEHIPADVGAALSTVRPSTVLEKGTMDELDPASTLVEEPTDPARFRVNYDMGYFAYDLTGEQQTALETLTNIVAEQRRTVVLNPGEMVIWDNHTTIHGRNSYPLHHNGRDRWLKRVYTKRDVQSCADLMIDKELNIFP
jgi:L-asparagine oxygenase